MTTTINQSNFNFKHVATRVLSMFMLAIMLFVSMGGINVYADGSDKPVDVVIDSSGNLNLPKLGSDDDIWGTIGHELATIISILSGLATAVMVGMCLFNMTKVATAGTNAKARTEALQAVGWTLAAAFGLGSVTVWVALAMNTGNKIQANNSSNYSIQQTTNVASVELNTELAQLELTM